MKKSFARERFHRVNGNFAQSCFVGSATVIFFFVEKFVNETQNYWFLVVAI